MFPWSKDTVVVLELIFSVHRTDPKTIDRNKISVGRITPTFHLGFARFTDKYVKRYPTPPEQKAHASVTPYMPSNGA